MSAFPLTKVPTLASYVSILRTIGAPVDAGLRRARLPTLFEEIPDAWIPYERVRYFTADMAEREVIPNLGLIPQASSLQHALTQSFLAPVLSTPSLFQALQRIPSLTSRITTDIRFWLEPAGDQIRACLEPYLLEGHLHAALAAEIIGCNMRNLQRKLAIEQTTYSEVVDNVRCRAAMSRLRDGALNLNEIALRRGYSEHAAFTRAFRRWTSIIPNEYRASQAHANLGSLTRASNLSSSQT